MSRPTLNLGSCNSARKLILRASTTPLQTALFRIQPATPATRAPHTRHFHHTPARRLFVAPEQVMAAVAGIAAGLLFVRKFPGLLQRLGYWKFINLSATVPLAWIANADPQTRDGVFSAISAGFALARSRPAGSQNDALREITFQLPHEIARLNKDAPQFKVEDMGPCPGFSDEALEVVHFSLQGVHPAFDMQKDTRVFLYYPNGAQKATAAFLVMNTDMIVPDPQKQHRIKRPLSPTDTQSKHEDFDADMSHHDDNASSENHALIDHATMLWINTYMTWIKDSPETIKDNIEPGDLPVIFCFRDKTCGSRYNQKTKMFDPVHGATVIVGLVQQD